MCSNTVKSSSDCPISVTSPPSKEMSRVLQPTVSFDEATRLLAETTEARFLLSTHDLNIGGSHDIRPSAELAARGGVLDPQALLDVKSTLIACRG